MKVVCFSGFLGGANDWSFLRSETNAFEFIHGFPDLQLDVETDFVKLNTSGHNPTTWDLACAQFISKTLPRFSAPQEKVFLLGYSLGGRMAANLLVRFPERFSGMVVISAHPGLTEPTERIERLQRDEVWAKRFSDSSGEPWTELMKDWYAQEVFRNDQMQEWPEESIELRQRCQRQLLLLSLGHQSSLSRQLIETSVPQIWITGSWDQKFSKLASELCKSSQKKLVHKEIIGYGHRWPWKMPSDKSAEVIIESLFQLNS